MPHRPLPSLRPSSRRVESSGMNDYDKAGRYLVKREPAGTFRWLLRNARLGFDAWIDSRRVVLPNQNDLTNDLVAAVHSGAAREAVCLELEAEARADALTRLLMYLARLWTEPGRIAWRFPATVASSLTSPARVPRGPCACARPSSPAAGWS